MIARMCDTFSLQPSVIPIRYERMTCCNGLVICSFVLSIVMFVDETESGRKVVVTRQV